MWAQYVSSFCSGLPYSHDSWWLLIMALQNLGIILLLLNISQKLYHIGTWITWGSLMLREKGLHQCMCVCVCNRKSVLLEIRDLTCLVGDVKVAVLSVTWGCSYGRCLSLMRWHYHWLPLSLLLQLVFYAVYLGSSCRSWRGFVGVLWPGGDCKRILSLLSWGMIRVYCWFSEKITVVIYLVRR